MLKKIGNFIMTAFDKFLKFFCVIMVILSILAAIIIIVSSNFNLEKFYLLFYSNIQILFTLYVFVITVNCSLLFLPKDKMLSIKEEFDTNIKNTRNSLGIIAIYFIINFLYMIYNSSEIEPKVIAITDNYSISNFAFINLFNIICFLVIFLFVILFIRQLIIMSEKIFKNTIKN